MTTKMKNKSKTSKPVQNYVYNEEEWYYESSNDDKYRYVLGTKGKNPLICFGINPSYASPEDLDPTMKRVCNVANENGNDSYIMLNISPIRATNPKDLEKVDVSHSNKNLEYISNILKKFPNSKIWAAWGSSIDKKDRNLIEPLEDINKLVKRYGCTWWYKGSLLKNKNPHHPLFLNNSTEFKEYLNMEEYIESHKKNEKKK